MQFDRDKYKHLVHYIAWRAGKNDWFGATKLYKVLWFADARLFVLTGKPITGETYVRKEFGPFPLHIMHVRDELERDGIIRVSKETDSNLTRIVALAPADSHIFSSQELSAVNFWIEHIDKDHTAASISDRTHDYAWEIAGMNEDLPLFAPLVSRIPEPDETDLQRLRERAKELGLL